MNNFIRKVSCWYFSEKSLSFSTILFIDSLIVIFAGILSNYLYCGVENVLNHFGVILCTWGCYLLSYFIGFRIFRTYSTFFRYSSLIDLLRIAGANLIAVIVIYLLSFFANMLSFIYFISAEELFTSFLIATIFMWALRIIVRFFYDYYFVSSYAQKVFIYGVKQGGVSLAKSICSQESKYIIAGFVSDDQEDWHHMLMGTKIYPNNETLVNIMRKKDASVLLVSPLKTESLRNNKMMVNSLIEAGIKVLICSQQELNGKNNLCHTQLKEVDIEDLLLRNQIKVDLNAIAKVLSSKCIMITGAAGSIGSEIVRQVASFNPSFMVLIDQAETPLHDIRLMMSRRFANIPCVTITVSICQYFHMEEIFARYHPEYVFHAAAYKHITMMEDNPVEAVINNVLGTQIIANLSVKYGVKKFVMISTDKAVNPTNVMGCSKRICEMYCQSLNNEMSSTQFVTTRFGNVLGSNGSVIPIFKEQIKAGGPLTVTHPDIIRYFMLIPEACSLVLQAGTMGKGGEIFVFDMGNPVKIADLAKRMILLSGASNIEIKYTGLRDGEKLYEELLNKEEDTKPSSHPKIKLASVRKIDYKIVAEQIDTLIRITKEGGDDMAIVKQMKVIVPEFKSKQSKYEVLDV